LKRTDTRRRRVRASRVARSPQSTARRSHQPVEGSLHLPRIPKGRRAQFFDDPAIDQLFAIVTALTAEVSVVAERLASLEETLQKSGVIAALAVERYVPSDAQSARRAVAREDLIARVFQVLEAYGGEPTRQG
jgi:hypothetical protein